MRSRKKLRFIILLLIVIPLIYGVSVFFSGVIIYPDSKLIYDRDFYNIKKVFFTSTDSYDEINRWFELKLAGIPHEMSGNQQEGNIDCVRRRWKQRNSETIVVVCNHEDNRTISTQVTVF